MMGKKAIAVLFMTIFTRGIICEDESATTDVQPATATESEASKAAQEFEFGPFGKRPSGHSFVRFGKRDQTGKGHSMLYFGKRAPDERHFAELLQYLQRNQEPSWKRGHSIMRFGKRASEKHNFIRFGKRDEDGIESLDDMDKRGGHSMMYFGKRNPFEEEAEEDMDKRGGHSMMYFGKRLSEDEDFDKRAGHSMMYFGKRFTDDDDLDKRGGHSMMYFGKRISQADPKKKAGHSMMYFGKRTYSDEDLEKRGGHSMMYFGKRQMSTDEDEELEGEDKRAGHSMMYFGKRSPSNGDSSGKSRSHSMMYFGKRMVPGTEEEDEKRAGHSMMYFGKRDDVEDENADMDEEKRASHSMLRFGKRQAAPYALDGSWIRNPSSFESLANQYYTGQIRRSPNLDKKKHNMMHFGKRSVEGEPMVKEAKEASYVDDDSKGQASTSTKHDRKKREIPDAMEAAPVASFSPFIPIYDTEEGYDHSDSNEPSHFGYNPVIPLKEIRDAVESKNSKNAFMRFGKH